MSKKRKTYIFKIGTLEQLLQEVENLKKALLVTDELSIHIDFVYDKIFTLKIMAKNEKIEK